MSTVNTTQGVSGTSVASAAASQTNEQQFRFLKLLTTQLQNQDPLSPMQNAEMTSQLAQMSTVEGIERLNTMVQQLINGQASSDALQSAALVGHGVLVPGKQLALTESGAIGGFDLPEGAEKVVVSIKDSTGAEVASFSFDNLDAGSHNFGWDGTIGNDSGEGGTKAAPGIYSVSVTATSGGEPVTVEPLTFGLVTGVIRGPSGSDLQVGELGVFKFDDIKQIL